MITNTKNDKVKFIKKLQQKARFRKEQGLFVCEGLRLVRETPKELLHSVFYDTDFYNDISNQGLIKRMEADGAQTFEVSFDVLKAMSGVEKPQGILAVVRMPKWDISDVYDSRDALFVVLSSLQDPGNLGTIIRTSEAAGAKAIIASGDTVDIFSPKVVRSTMGGIFRMPYVVEDDLAESLANMSSKGIKTVASVLSEDSVSYDSLDMTKPVAVIIGNEGNGIAPEIIEAADCKAHIPMVGECESLNASVAAGVMVMEAARQRRNAHMV